MRVRWLRAALSNLDAEADYIAQDNPAAADDLVSAIVEATERLKRYPALGRPGRVTGTRELVVPGTPYIIPYRIRTGVVEIIRVFHAARRWPRQF
ncbi:MAG: type II toxin-antitoxin system mRNA interferase toxin, RelE/StbE family [Acidobacteria bacterium]|nr:MAG: type II toxin-antitoxin system mRNA interferase toxin, RelE/StbE family [Acidobacteriota bacterium]